MGRHFLFLQGNASYLFKLLGQSLDELEYRVSRINLCGGDWLFWGDWNALDFMGEEAGFADFALDYCLREGVSDVVLHNDCRPTHRALIEKATHHSLSVWIFEEGYLRPNWLTLEKGGINGFSRLPKDPNWYLGAAANLPPWSPGQPVGAGMRNRVIYDFRWQWANYRYFLRYPNYRTHRPYPIWAEYITWAKRLLALKIANTRAEDLIERFIAEKQDFYVFPLQLDSDSQIRIHSPFKSLPAAIEHVIRNFAAHSPGDSHLIIKNHPLDNGWINYARRIRRCSASLGIKERVHFIDGGDLNLLIDHSRAVVTVNSTVGFTALDRGSPLICLGKAIFNIPGLTFQNPLDDFWTAPCDLDKALYGAFKKVVLNCCLVNGNYYTEQGLTLAVKNSLDRLTAQTDLISSHCTE